MKVAHCLRSRCCCSDRLHGGAELQASAGRGARRVPRRARRAPTPPRRIADTKWQDLFPDQTLNQMVDHGAGAQLRPAHRRGASGSRRARNSASRAPISIPFVDAQAGFTGARSSSLAALPVPPGTSLSASYTTLGAALSWELDLWGRLRRLTEAARARYLASEEGRARGARLAGLRRDGDLLPTAGAGSGTGDQPQDAGHRQGQPAIWWNCAASAARPRASTCSQAEQLLYTAGAQSAAARARHRAERKPAQPAAGQRARGAGARPQAGRDSDARADCRRACRPRCWSAGPISARRSRTWWPPTREIGAARALYFPQLSLSAFAGGQSRSLLRSRQRAGARLQRRALGAAIRSFIAGQIRNQVRFTRGAAARVADHLPAFHLHGVREVSDALVSFDRLREQRSSRSYL